MAEQRTAGMKAAAAILMASVLLSRILGLAREALLAARLGTGLEADAYAVAFMIPDLLNTLLAGGFLSLSFLPRFVRLRDEGGPAGAFVGDTVFLLSAAGVLVGGILWVLAGPVALLMQPGLAGKPSLDLAIHLTRIILPAQLFFLISAAFTSVQYAQKRFLVPALSPLVYNVGILLGGWLLAPRMGAEGFAWGVAGGALVGPFLLQWWGARRSGVRAALSWDPRMRAEIGGLVWQTLPLMLGLTLQFSAEFLIRRQAGFLPDGTVAEANYAFRLTMVLIGFFGQAAGVASYPYFVELARTGRLEELGDMLRIGVARLAAVLLPASAFVTFFAEPLVALAFERGAFAGSATREVAAQLRWMTWAVLPWCIQILMARAFYARGRFWFSAALGTGLVLAVWPLWSGLRLFGGKIAVGQGLLLLVAAEGLAFIVAWFALDRDWKAARPWLGLWHKPLLLGTGCAYLAWRVGSLLPAPWSLAVGAALFLSTLLALAIHLRLPGYPEAYASVRARGARVVERLRRTRGSGTRRSG